MHSDRPPTLYSFGKSFWVFFPSREDWAEGESPLIPEERDWFTDCSKGNSGTGAGIFCLQDGVGFGVPIVSFPTVFQAEVTEIMERTWENVRMWLKGQNVNIFFDSQVALRVLDSCEFKSQLV
jgi:hypothetical protein